jgi:hypothetical protein
MSRCQFAALCCSLRSGYSSNLLVAATELNEFGMVMREHLVRGRAADSVDCVSVDTNYVRIHATKHVEHSLGVLNIVVSGHAFDAFDLGSGYTDHDSMRRSEPIKYCLGVRHPNVDGYASSSVYRCVFSSYHERILDAEPI